MARTIIACIGSSLLTVGILSLAGFGPLDPPTGPISPTSVTLDQLAATIAANSPGGNVPGRMLSGAGTATLVFTDRTVTVPLIGYTLSKPNINGGFLSLAVEAGLVSATIHTTPATTVTITINGSDGSTIGPMNVTRRSRDQVNGPVVGGNKAVSVLHYNTGAGNPPMSDESGAGLF
jgi:hypothetical protein